MLDDSICDSTHRPARPSAHAKLRAALEYLGDRLTTHRASRFKPGRHFLLDEWLAARRASDYHRAPNVARSSAI
jgi:hypothetical protein